MLLGEAMCCRIHNGFNIRQYFLQNGHGKLENGLPFPLLLMLYFLELGELKLRQDRAGSQARIVRSGKRADAILFLIDRGS